jgi:hypothetical protein
MINSILLDSFKDILVNEYEFQEVAEKVFQGFLDKKNDTKVLFSFRLLIDLNPINLGRLPIVQDLDQIIPNNLEYHKYTKINAFCFGVGLHERIIYNRMLKDFKWFIEKQVKGFLSAYIIKDLTGEWGAEEFSHDELTARKQSLQKLLGVYDFSQNGIKLLELNVIYKSETCYCGSGKNYIYCHYDSLLRLQGKISLIDVINEINRIKELIINENS